MDDIQKYLAPARIITALAEVMTPEQRRTAAAKVRALTTDDPITRDFFADTAAGLERFADEEAEHG